MRINKIPSQNFKGIHKDVVMYYDYPNEQYGNMLAHQVNSMISVNSVMRGSGRIGSECPIADLHEAGWNLLASPSADNVYGIDIALITGDKFYKEKTENIFGAPRVTNKLDYAKAIILGSFYSIGNATEYDLETIKKHNELCSESNKSKLYSAKELKARIKMALDLDKAGKFTQKINRLA